MWRALTRLPLARLEVIGSGDQPMAQWLWAVLLASGAVCCHLVGMRADWVQQYCSSVGKLVMSIRMTTWDQTWQAASTPERSMLTGAIIAGVTAGLAATFGLRAALPAVSWLSYYGLWIGLYAWLGRSRSIADVPGRDLGIRMAVVRAKELGLDTPKFPNWTRDVFRRTLTADQPNAIAPSRWLAWWLDGPVGVVVGTVLGTAAVVLQHPVQPEPVDVRLLGSLPLAFGLAAAQRVYLHRKSQRADFAGTVDREVSARLTSHGTPSPDKPASGSALPASADAVNVFTLVVVPVVIAVAVGLFFYVLPPLYH